MLLTSLKQETTNQIALSLTMLFSKSLMLGIFRQIGNSRILYPFSRKERETFWRNIALFPFSLSSPKISSTAFRQGLRDHISHLISREQHGFSAGRYCVTQLTSVLHYIGDQLDAAKQIDIIYLDMSKASSGSHQVTWKVATIRHYWQT